MVDEELNLDKLKVQDYSNKPRHQTRAYDQKAALGDKVDILDRIDMSRLDELDKGEGTDLLEGEASTLSELATWSQGLNKDEYMWPVRGSTGVSEEEVGEIQAQVHVYPENKKRFSRLVKRGDFSELIENGIIENIDQDTRVFEVSYNKLLRLKVAPGQVSSSLRQAMADLPSAIQTRENIPYDQKINILVTAYVDPIDDPDSIKVLENSGFIKVGEIQYKPENTRKDWVYVLSPKLLHMRLLHSSWHSIYNMAKLADENRHQK